MSRKCGERIYQQRHGDALKIGGNRVNFQIKRHIGN